MAFAGILDKIRRKKQEFALTAADAYFQLVREVASGAEVDVDSAAIAIDAAAKTDEQFEDDVSNQQKRFQEAKRLKRKREIESAIPKLTTDVESARKQLQDAVAKLQPELSNCAAKLRDHESELLTLQSIEAWFVGSCINPTILNRDAELQAQRMELVDKLRPLSDDFRSAKSYVSTCRAGVATKQDPKHLLEWQQRLTQAESTCKQLADAIERLNVQLKPIDRELAELHERKLVP